jgi:hypothetical protein
LQSVIYEFVERTHPFVKWPAKYRETAETSGRTTGDREDDVESAGPDVDMAGLLDGVWEEKSFWDGYYEFLWTLLLSTCGRHVV